MMERPVTVKATQQPEYKNRYIILCIVLAGVFMGVLDSNVVNVALPTITQYFNVELARSQWIVTAYLVVNTALLLIFGRLSEYTGKVRLFFVGIAIFTISSLACGFAGDIDQLIFFRIVQGIGASVVFSINSAILVQAFPKKERGRTLGLIGTIVAIGSIAGPILGGFITGALGWQYIFFINVPVGIVLLAIASKYLKLPELRCKVKGMDWIGAAALMFTMVSLMLLLGELANGVRIDLAMAVLGGIFIIAISVFVYTELDHKSPIIDLRIFKVRKFSFANMSTFISFTAFAMFIITMPFFMELVWGYSPQQVGGMLLAVPFIMAVVSPLSGYLYDKLQSTYHSSFGMLVTAIALLAMGYVVLLHDPILLLVCFGIFGFGSGLFTSPNNTEIMSALPMQKSSMASSTLATVRNFGNAIGVSFASILLYIMLENAGYASVIASSPGVLASSISNVLYIGGGLCIIGVFTSLMVGWSKKQELNIPAACEVPPK